MMHGPRGTIWVALSPPFWVRADAVTAPDLGDPFPQRRERDPVSCRSGMWITVDYRLESRVVSTPVAIVDPVRDVQRFESYRAALRQAIEVEPELRPVRSFRRRRRN